jgi:hypothetical protein
MWLYVLSLKDFNANNEEHIQTIMDVHGVNTRHKYYPHKPSANFSCFQKSTYFTGINIFNNLLSDLKSLMAQKSLKQYLNTHSFYSFEYQLS